MLNVHNVRCRDARVVHLTSCETIKKIRYVETNGHSSQMITIKKSIEPRMGVLFRDYEH